MADAVTHGRVVLSAILAGRGTQVTRALDFAASRLTPDHFTDPVQRKLFILCQLYAGQTRAIMPRRALDDLMRSEAPGRVLQYAEYYDALCQQIPSAAEFRWAVAQLSELSDDRDTGDALSEGMEILQGRFRDDHGTLIHGSRAAREHVLAAFAGIEQRHAGAETPEGDVRAEQQRVLARYAEAKKLRVSGSAPGVAFGIPGLDRRLPAGVLPGSLNIVLAWVSAGKTSWCTSWAWHAAVAQGRDVVYFTTETLRPQVTAKLVARHSRLEKFGLPQGLDSAQILAGSLVPDEEQALQAVLKDFREGPYGRINVIQTPRAATIGTVEAKLAAIGRQYRPAIVFMDYLQLLAPERRYRDSRMNEDLSGIVKEAGQVAATFADGAGIPFVSPWQVSREGRKAALASGGYSLLSVAETKEAADSADLVLALLDPEKYENPRSVAIEATVLKNRDGPRNFSVRLTADYTTCWFGEEDRTTGDSVINMGG